MKSISKLFLLVLALVVGLALAENHDKTEGQDKASMHAADQSTEAREAMVPSADTNGDMVVSHEEADAAFEQLAAQVAGREFAHPSELEQFLAARDDTTLFLLLLQQSGLAETFVPGQPMTIFAPSDSAFARLDRLQFATLIHDPMALRAVLEQHIMVDAVAAADGDGEVAGGGAADGPDQAALMVDDAQIVERDLEAGGATIHVIDTVLLPGM